MSDASKCCRQKWRTGEKGNELDMIYILHRMVKENFMIKVNVWAEVKKWWSKEKDHYRQRNAKIEGGCVFGVF